MKTFPYWTLSACVMILGAAVVQPCKGQGAPTGSSEGQPAGGLTSRYPLDAGLASDPAVIFAENFEAWSASAGQAAGGRWNVRQNKTSRTHVTPGRIQQGEVPGPGQQVLEIACWTDGSGSQVGGLSLKLGNYEHRNENLGDGYDDLYVRYYLKLAADYRGVRNHGANLGGRDVTRNDAAWVGMAGIRDVSTRGYFYSGVQPYGQEGSTELEMGFYSYHLDKRGPWGENYEMRRHVPIQPGVWYCVERHLKLNTVDPARADPANADGIEELWIDGELTIRKVGVRFRRVPQLRTTLFSLETYYHGLPKELDRDHPIRVYFDNVVVARQYVGPMHSAPR